MNGAKATAISEVTPSALPTVPPETVPIFRGFTPLGDGSVFGEPTRPIEKHPADRGSPSTDGSLTSGPCKAEGRVCIEEQGPITGSEADDRRPVPV